MIYVHTYIINHYYYSLSMTLYTYVFSLALRRSLITPHSVYSSWHVIYSVLNKCHRMFETMKKQSRERDITYICVLEPHATLTRMTCVIYIYIYI